MDGPPDHEELENKRLLDELENTAAKIKEELAECQDKLIQRAQELRKSQKENNGID